MVIACYNCKYFIPQERRDGAVLGAGCRQGVNLGDVMRLFSQNKKCAYWEDNTEDKIINKSW